jgi:uncharacterized glyoxalase superfamily protein PhnB
MADAVAISSWRVAPYFIVDDVVATANFYRDTLGFDYERFWGEPPCFSMVYRNGVIIMLSQFERTGVMRPNHLWIDNADALNAEFKSRGVNVTRAVCDQPYGCRDFETEDCNGYRLCFGQDLEGH